MKRRKFLAQVSAATVIAGAGPFFTNETASGASTSKRQRKFNTGDLQQESSSINNLQVIDLLPPQKNGGKPVMAALQERKTIRSIKTDKLPPQILSNLLWAAFGVNRKTGKGPFGRTGRTAASPSNSQEIDLYVVLSEGIYIYDALPHRLAPVLSGDYRTKVGDHGQSDSMAHAPVNLIFVADLEKYADSPYMEPGLKDPEVQKSYYSVTTGLIAGNVHVFAASEGLAAWFHNCNRKGLTKLLNLRSEQHVIYAQTIGYPEKD